MRKAWFWLAALAVLTLGAGSPALDWEQWAQNSAHTGAVGVRGQRVERVEAQVLSDPFTLAERANPLYGGDLGVHYQTPLVNDDQVCIETKSGHYHGLADWNSQVWGERCLQWKNGSLVPQWSVRSDWWPVPYALGDRGPHWEPVFHGVGVGPRLYLPARGGTLLVFDHATGAPLGRVNPFPPGIDPQVFAVGPLVSDGANVFYYAVQLNLDDPWGSDLLDAWLVRVDPDGRATVVSFRTLTPALRPGTTCLSSFAVADLPWPPRPDAVPPSGPCGGPRPPINAAPAVAPDGTVYLESVAHLNSWTAWLVALNPDLSLRWQSSLQDLFDDGCGVLLPPSGTPGGCRAGATRGVDPAQNRPGAARLNDDSTASPVVTPDGKILLGTFTRYNRAQGHLVQFSPQGAFLAAYPFGWDVTPAVYIHGSTYSVVTKDNHYGGIGSYCDDSEWCPATRTGSDPAGPEGYFLTQLDDRLVPEWRFQNLNHLSCRRGAAGGLACISDHPAGFEWCINAPAVDAAGVVYGTSEDGWVYAVGQGGLLRARLFLQLALGGAYTPLALDRVGRLYAQNDGTVFALGQARAR